ncbi:MAG: 16S rRNA (adenine(1518)-N(6)/adenine(1519)-N(6))-dimethyltransferase RsmA [Planctomycetota bacterium]
MQTLSEIRAILTARGLSPKHRFGQNFLVDHNLLRRLVDASGIGAGSLVVEIGPGTGTMSEEILARGAELVAIELDRDLAAHLREHLAANPRFRLVEGDCLDGKRALNAEALAALGGRPFTLVANLPYQAASPVMAICASTPQCRGQFVTIQREVGDRLRAKPGTGEYGPLTIMVQAFCEVEQVAVLPPGCFWPPPEVTSAMLALRPRATPAVPHADADRFGAFVHTLFSKRRKQIGAILGRDRAYPEGIDPNARPESLPVAELVRLWRAG